MRQLSRLNSVQEFVSQIKKELEKRDLPVGELFERCFKSTLDTTVQMKEDGSVFIVTGDIPAMWLRDSSCQVKPYLCLAGREPQIADMIAGVILRQISCILIDPYANAFNETANGNGWQTDLTKMHPHIWERKYEIDSLCFPMELSYLYWKNTGRTDIFTDEFLQAARSIVTVFRTEQDHENSSDYLFERRDCIYTDTLSRNGKGALVKPHTGLIWSGFRPSDDSCVYGYLIPSNMFAAVILEYISQIAREIYKDFEFAEEAAAFSKSVREAVTQHAVIPMDEKRFDKPFYAYEVDGYGEYLIMDDANLPSLLAMPHFGYCDADDELYLNTKEMMLGEANPYYFSGKYAAGIGSPHTREDYVWHLSMGVQGLTAAGDQEKRHYIECMAATDGGTGWMHESLHVNDPAKFTRESFLWANAIFAELVMDYCGYKIKK